ncbi:MULTISPECIES: tyrosine-protein phosphatase [Emticicia]|uniref:tyrosine-protein phosphatase n=1 Tax=Emticicia TaxID=312278 RepID=UPI0007D8A286|nr:MULTISPECIES: CpsB/CapC family capsule biosynthesis tyrosine phosphatase [Emticicia]
MFESIFKRDVLSGNTPKPELTVDIHAHVLPQLDDGPVDIEQSIEIIKEMYAMGYRKIIATPHVMAGYYNNAPEDILQSLHILKTVLKRRNITMELEAAAEYYLEDELFRLIECHEVLTFGGSKKYLLFEASFVTKASYILEAVIKIKQAGYTPVLAHPERYVSLNDLDVINRLSCNGALFQVNIGSLTGYYSKQAQELAELLISKKLVAFLGSDCHSIAQLESIKHAFKLKTFKEATQLNILNNTLMEKKTTVFA